MNEYNLNGKKHGTWVSYNSNGVLDSKTHYINGELHGIQERYFSKDSLWLRIAYENNKQNGLFEQYFDNGQLQHVGHQKNGKSFGISCAGCPVPFFRRTFYSND